MQRRPMRKHARITTCRSSFCHREERDWSAEGRWRDISVAPRVCLTAGGGIPRPLALVSRRPPSLKRNNPQCRGVLHPAKLRHSRTNHGTLREFRESESLARRQHRRRASRRRRARGFKYVMVATRREWTDVLLRDYRRAVDPHTNAHAILGFRDAQHDGGRAERFGQ